MNSSDFIQYGKAVKPFDQLSKGEMEESQLRIHNKVRERAWAVGSPVYYSINGLMIAEYEDGRKMVVEEMNGELMETKKYEGAG